MSLRILHVVAPNSASPWLSPHAANAAWLAPALRERGHEVTVRIAEAPAYAASPAATEGFDIVHVHDVHDAFPPGWLPRRGTIVTAYTPAPVAGSAPWIALSAQQRKAAASAPVAVTAPCIDTGRVPAARTADDALVFAFDGHDEYALGAAISVAAHAERPLDVVIPDSAALADACCRRIDDAAGSGAVRLHRIARDEFPAPIATAAACLAFNRAAFDMGALTAMACGTPVITFEGMPAAAVIVGGESGWVCRSPEEAGRALDRLHILQPALGRSRARIAFDAASCAAQHEEIYHRLLDGGDPVGAWRHPEQPTTATAAPAGSQDETVLAA